jgi:hypothetical protein
MRKISYNNNTPPISSLLSSSSGSGSGSPSANIVHKSFQPPSSPPKANQTSGKKNNNSAEPEQLDAYCRPVYKRMQLRINGDCQPLEYQVVECSGYCQSQSMVGKNEDEVRVASCCSLTGVNRRLVRVYCTRTLRPDEVRNAPLYSQSRDAELLKLFQASFGAASWTEHVVYKNRHVYSGFYSVSLYFDASCECEII